MHLVKGIFKHLGVSSFGAERMLVTCIIDSTEKIQDVILQCLNYTLNIGHTNQFEMKILGD